MEIKTINLSDFIKRVPPKITGGEIHEAAIFGETSRYLDFESNLTVIFDYKNLTVFLVELFDDNADIIKRWVNPIYLDVYIKFIQIRDWRFESDRPNVDNLEDMLKYLDTHYDK